MKRKIMNDRGIGGSGIAFFVVLVVAAVVVVFVIAVNMGWFGQVSGGINQIPGDLGKRAGVCENKDYNSELAWCNYEPLTDRKLEWANCAHPVILAGLRNNKKFKMPDFDCVGVSIDTQISRICENSELSMMEKSNILINNDKKCGVKDEEVKAGIDFDLEGDSGGLGTHAEVCSIAYKVNQALWCDFVRIAGQEWANCDHPKIREAFEKSGVEALFLGTCKGSPVSSQISEICNAPSLSENEKKNVVINGVVNACGGYSGIGVLQGELGQRGELCRMSHIYNRALWCSLSKIDDLEWANCDHPKILLSLEAQDVESEHAGSCDDNFVSLQVNNICQDVVESGGDLDLVIINEEKGC